MPLFSLSIGLREGPCQGSTEVLNLLLQQSDTVVQVWVRVEAVVVAPDLSGGLQAVDRDAHLLLVVSFVGTEEAAQDAPTTEV